MSLKESIIEFNNLLGENESLLDKNYSNIARAINLHWGYKEFYLYVNKLLLIDKERSGGRFPIEVLQEIYKLQALHNILFPETHVLSANLAQFNARERVNQNSVSF